MDQDGQDFSRQQIECTTHGRKEYCIICWHLSEQSGLGFYASTAEVFAPAQAWCEGCDVVLEEERGWSDRAEEFADLKLLCSACYEETLRRHRFISWSVGSDEELLRQEGAAWSG